MIFIYPMSVSLTCCAWRTENVLLSCMSTLIHSHLWMRTPAVNSHSLTSSGWKNQLVDVSFSLSSLTLYTFEEIKQSLNFTCAGAQLAHLNASGYLLDSCQSMTPGIWQHSTFHHPQSIPPASAILAVHQGNKGAPVVRAEYWQGKQSRSCLTPWFTAWQTWFRLDAAEVWYRRERNTFFSFQTGVHRDIQNMW